MALSRMIQLMLIVVASSHVIYEHKCEPGYVRNPYSGTCLRKVSLMKSWFDAKSYCEKQGETLVVFDSFESIYWFDHLRRTNSYWGKQPVWLGGKKDSSGIWRWYGRLTSAIKIAVWWEGQPSGDGDCLDIWSQFGQWNDADCSVKLNFVCEK